MLARTGDPWLKWALIKATLLLNALSADFRAMSLGLPSAAFTVYFCRGVVNAVNSLPQ